MTSANATVLVRAQALGGKYLGPAAGAAPILNVLIDGKPIGASVTIPNLGSGTVEPKWDSTSSPYTIVVEPDPGKSPWYPPAGTFYLDPPAPGQADVIVSIPLSVPTNVEFQITAAAPQPVVSSRTVLIQPGQSYTNSPPVIVLVPGLYVPTVTLQAASGQVSIQAKVQMMCGCPIISIPASAPPPAPTETFWPSTEFEVFAIFAKVQRAADVAASPASIPPPKYVSLNCTTTDMFTGSVSLPPGTWVCVISAYQPSTGNTGTNSTTIVLT